MLGSGAYFEHADDMAEIRMTQGADPNASWGPHPARRNSPPQLPKLGEPRQYEESLPPNTKPPQAPDVKSLNIVPISNRGEVLLLGGFVLGVRMITRSDTSNGHEKFQPCQGCRGF